MSAKTGENIVVKNFERLDLEEKRK
jgi:hypothetical protein